MRVLTLCTAMLLAAPALADMSDYDYSEERELTLAAAGLNELVIDAGAGPLEVTGEPGADMIIVRATILVDGAKGDKAREFIEGWMDLSLDQNGNEAMLIAGFRDSMGNGKNGAVALDITVPQGMALQIDDGSGSIQIRDTMADVRVDDGSGSLAIRGAANVKVDDGSGSVEVSDATGDVRIDDGSGSVTVRRVTGNVAIDDGSGSINVKDIQGDFRVIDDGSGSINYSNVMGQVDVPED